MRAIAKLLPKLALAIALLPPAAQAQSIHVLVEPLFPEVGDEVRIRLMSGAPFRGQQLKLGERRGSYNHLAPPILPRRPTPSTSIYTPMG